jgi:hypothetical protein
VQLARYSKAIAEQNTQPQQHVVKGDEVTVHLQAVLPQCLAAVQSGLQTLVVGEVM